MLIAVGLIISSVLLSARIRTLGLDRQDLLQRRVEYEERRKTRLGTKAHRPHLIRRTESFGHLCCWALGPMVANGVGLHLLYRFGLSGRSVLLVGLLVCLEFGFVWWLQYHHWPQYRVDYDNYMRLTQAGNQYFDGTLVDQRSNAANLVDGGRIVQASQIVFGRIKSLQLFISFKTDQHFPIRQLKTDRIRIFYRPHDRQSSERGLFGEGELIGFQSHQFRSDSNLDFETRVVMN